MTNKQPPQVHSFSVTKNQQYIIDYLEEMAQRERKSKSKVILRCIEYYYNKKWPGNPQPPLFPPDKPPKQTIGLKEARLRKASVFLRFKGKLGYRQVAQVVGCSVGFIYNLCKSVEEVHSNFDGRRMPKKKKRAQAFRKGFNLYRKRFQQWMDGRYETVEEAFTFNVHG